MRPWEETGLNHLVGKSRDDRPLRRSHRARACYAWFMARALLTTLGVVHAFLSAGCGSVGDESPPDQVAIQVDVNAAPVTFSWSGGAVHELYIWECGELCAPGGPAHCQDNGFDPGTTVDGPWAIKLPFEAGVPTPAVVSPVQYGILDGKPDDTAGELLAATRYAVVLQRYGLCEGEPAEECRMIEASGCKLFVTK